MGFSQAFDQGQSEAGTCALTRGLGLDTIEWIEDLLTLLKGNARPVVLHLYQAVIILISGTHVDCLVGTLMGVFYGIVKEVDHNLCHCIAIEDQGRLYSDKEIALILRKATDLQQESGSAAAEGLSLPVDQAAAPRDARRREIFASPLPPEQELEESEEDD